MNFLEGRSGKIFLITALVFFSSFTAGIGTVCGNGVKEAGEECDPGAFIADGLCTPEECIFPSCTCKSGSSGLKIVAIEIKPSSTLNAGIAPKEFDVNVFVNNSNQGTLRDIDLTIYRVFDEVEIDTLNDINDFPSNVSTKPVFAVDVMLEPGFDLPFESLPTGSYKAVVRIKNQTNDTVLSLRDTFFTVVSPKATIEVSEQSPLLVLLAALIVAAMIAGNDKKRIRP